MVRINLIAPKNLADQHLIAEYNEILMLLGYVKRYPDAVGIPERYALGKGHIKFFKDKLLYLKKRHGDIRKEMRRRGFRADRDVILYGFPDNLKKDWLPNGEDKRIIKKRLLEKIEKKPDFYRYCRKKRSPEFLKNLINDSE